MIKHKKLLIIIIIFGLILVTIGFSAYKTFKVGHNFDMSYLFSKKENKNYSENDLFRNLVVKFVRESVNKYFTNQSIDYPEELNKEGEWDLKITLYSQGKILGQGKSDNKILAYALEEAVKNIIEDKKLTQEDVEKARFLVSLFSFSDQPFSFIETTSGVEGKEIIDDLVIIRNLDKELIRQKIEQGKEFLFKMMNKNDYGFYKIYDALDDSFEDRLHTVYSASIIYTFLYINDWKKDERTLEQIHNLGNFLLSMQNKDKQDIRYGAFHYSYYLFTEEKEKKFVVGTSALSIFTLLRLYDLTNDPKYLESAKLAGDWLATMQKTDGSMKAYTKYSNGEWIYGTNESLLYNGQVLSALSKLYKATGEEKYYNTAERIVQRHVEKVEKEGCYLGDDYRLKNPISSAWVVMSLLDFYKISQNEHYKNIIFECSNELLERQRKDTNLLNNGQWEGAYSTSGTGWISEVMADVYKFCLEQDREDCGQYKEGVIKGIRWIIQNTYSEENSFLLKNPERAIGGVFWNQQNRYVRTDSVCHGLNGYTIIINYLENGLLLSFPEESLEEILK